MKGIDFNIYALTSPSGPVVHYQHQLRCPCPHKHTLPVRSETLTCMSWGLHSIITTGCMTISTQTHLCVQPCFPSVYLSECLGGSRVKRKRPLHHHHHHHLLPPFLPFSSLLKSNCVSPQFLPSIVNIFDLRSLWGGSLSCANHTHTSVS